LLTRCIRIKPLPKKYQTNPKFNPYTVVFFALYIVVLIRYSTTVVYVYWTVTGRKHEINLNVIVTVDSRVCLAQVTTASSGMFGRREVTPTTTVVMHS